MSLRKNIVMTISIILLICLIEGIFDVAEIIIGGLLEITNPFRVRSGTIWEIDKQDQIADQHLLGITENIPHKDQPPVIETLDKLKLILDEQESVVVSADQFLRLYNLLPPRSAHEIISPFDLLKIFQSNQWIWTKIIKDENSLSFIFQDGDNQILMDSYPDLAVLYHVATIEISKQTSLASMASYSDRTFSPKQFFEAFSNLPNPIKLQLINNPFRLIKWYKNIKLVAISRFVENNTVSIGFEIFNGIDYEIHTFQASELAANYLIAQLNVLSPNLDLKIPEP